MPSSIAYLLSGFHIALTIENLIYCWLGAMLGTIVGVLPGIGPLTAIALLLPLTFHMPAVGAIIMLAGIYYGANHAGSTTAIMLNMPGEPAAVVICFDGYPLAKEGRAGAALCMAALASFIAGCISILILGVFSEPLQRIAMGFQGPEYTSAIILALCSVSALSGGAMINTMGMTVVGLILGTVGTDITSGTIRFAMGEVRLFDGIGFIPVALALFALVDVALTLGSDKPKGRVHAKFAELMPRIADLRACVFPVLRGTAIGGTFGVLPGTGPLIASFTSYALEKRIARRPERFGRGAIEGVAGPEAAANAAAFTHFIPTLSLGIPAGPAMALLLAALLIKGIHPGPQMMVQHPDVFWGLIASMWVGNLMLLLLNLPLVGIWVKLLAIPYRLLYPAIVLLCLIGVYSERNEVFDVYLCAVVLIVGWLLIQMDCNPAGLVLAMILGPTLEENLRRSLLISRGDPSVFFTRPVSAGLLLLAAIVIVALVIGRRRGRSDLGKPDIQGSLS
jgi:TctA family transporter